MNFKCRSTIIKCNAVLGTKKDSYFSIFSSNLFTLRRHYQSHDSGVLETIELIDASQNLFHHVFIYFYIFLGENERVKASVSHLLTFQIRFYSL